MAITGQKLRPTIPRSYRAAYGDPHGGSKLRPAQRTLNWIPRAPQDAARIPAITRESPPTSSSAPSAPTVTVMPVASHFVSL